MDLCAHYPEMACDEQAKEPLQTSRQADIFSTLFATTLHAAPTTTFWSSQNYPIPSIILTHVSLFELPHSPVPSSGLSTHHPLPPPTPTLSYTIYEDGRGNWEGRRLRRRRPGSFVWPEDTVPICSREPSDTTLGRVSRDKGLSIGEIERSTLSCTENVTT